MEKIIWSDKFSVGIRELDEQHYKIINLINKLLDFDEKLPCEVVTTNTLREMIRYARTHLIYEEKLLKQNNFPDYEQHCSLHAKYLKDIAGLSESVSENCNIETLKELLNYLVHWWKNHILYEDMKFKVYLKEKGLD